MRKRMLQSGIQRKYLKYTITLLALALCLSSIGVWAYMQKSVRKTIVDKYRFIDEKMGIALDNMYRKSDEVTAECIVYDDVQKSLQKNEMEEVNRTALSKYFAYIDLDYVSEYCYVDNKCNVYSRYYSDVSYADFKQSGFEGKLGGDYSKTVWFWADDNLFGTGEPSLFIGRYVRSMEYAHEPGMLFLKMDEKYLDKVVSNGVSEEAFASGIMDANGNLCSLNAPEEMWIPMEDISLKTTDREGDGMILDGMEVSGGVVSAYRQKESGFIVFSFVPDSVLNSGTRSMLFVLAGIYVIVIAIALVLSIYFSQRFTRPIQDISEAMSSFDGKDFDHTIELETHTELDQIGRSYNEMLGNIEELLEEIKIQQQELRTSELNMLISQINPHFLYNTLDTIYMLARINKEETTMKMIQALSKYLRLSLSKGKDVVTVEDELENVKSYMEIQQIRNENLFRYEIDCQVDPKQTYVLKLVLQPLVENAIKYGFCDIFEGGFIRIEVKKAEEALEFVVYNNGTSMEEETVQKLNDLNELPLSKVKGCFPDKNRGYGLVNIITRLRLKYGDEVRILYHVESEGTSCVIRIPGGEGHVE
ncbi:sensor histidine kinase [Bariatricus sp. SGI.161]|uniref:sensor histidine kinase n=1 Tax=Bariatricus sp. SGI.161 TaxID=3420550 RepID=UPI003D07D3C0